MVSPYSHATDTQEAMVDINTTPLIDVMLVLLIMLIITIPVQTDAVRMDLPSGPPPMSPPPHVVLVEVTTDGTIKWDGQILSDQADLEGHMRQASQAVDQPELHVRPAGEARYGSVAAVLAAAQRQGVSKIGIVGVERFLN